MLYTLSCFESNSQCLKCAKQAKGTLRNVLKRCISDGVLYVTLNDTWLILCGVLIPL